MPTVALVTSRKFPDLTPDDRLLLDPLRCYGFQTKIVTWNDPGVQWDHFDMLCIRSIWDYHEHLLDFERWMVTISSFSIPVWNSIQDIQWNMYKPGYLTDLMNNGIPVIPFATFTSDQVKNLADVCKKNKWDTIVCKPAIGGSGKDVQKFDVRDLNDAMNHCTKIGKYTECIVQPYLDGIKEGEISCIYIGSVYSHAVIKKSTAQEFRINNAFGGKEEHIDPDRKVRHLADRVIKCLSSNLLYARVDFIQQKHQFWLIELEIIDPYLFFSFHPYSAVTMATRMYEFYVQHSAQKPFIHPAQPK